MGVLFTDLQRPAHTPTPPTDPPHSFTYELPSGQKVVTQDWYDVGGLRALDAKESLVRKCLDEGGRDAATLGLNFTSGSSFPFALPPSVAKGAFGYRGMNERLMGLLADLMMQRAAKSQSEQRATAATAPAPAGSWTGAMQPLMNIINLDYYDSQAQLVPLLIQANFLGR